MKNKIFLLILFLFLPSMLSAMDDSVVTVFLNNNEQVKVSKSVASKLIAISKVLINATSNSEVKQDKLHLPSLTQDQLTLITYDQLLNRLAEIAQKLNEKPDNDENEDEGEEARLCRNNASKECYKLFDFLEKKGCVTELETITDYLEMPSVDCLIKEYKNRQQRIKYNQKRARKLANEMSQDFCALTVKKCIFYCCYPCYLCSKCCLDDCDDD